MPTHQTAFCERCGYERRFRKRRMNHGIHLVITILSAGVWSVAWVSATIKHAQKPWRCSFCGSRRSARRNSSVADERYDQELGTPAVAGGHSNHPE